MKPITIGQTITNRQDTSLNIYFKDVSKQSMIDSDEEIELAKRIKQGDKKAMDKLINANLRFVISVAKQYQNKGIPLVDLIQCGNIGLIEAAKRFNEDRGFKFISYAVWWIRQSIIQSISSECRTVRTPMNQIVCISKIGKANDKLEQELERSPATEELSSEINVSTNKINTALLSVNKSVSLDSPLKEDGCLLDILPDSFQTDEYIVNDSISKEINSILLKLPNREADVIRMSFGLGMYPMTLEEIGSRFGISSERVRQIQKEAIERIRKEYSDDLKELL